MAREWDRGRLRTIQSGDSGVETGDAGSLGRRDTEARYGLKQASSRVCSRAAPRWFISAIFFAGICSTPG